MNFHNALGFLLLLSIAGFLFYNYSIDYGITETIKLVGIIGTCLATGFLIGWLLAK